jgi:hypothetical protein
MTHSWITERRPSWLAASAIAGYSSSSARFWRTSEGCTPAWQHLQSIKDPSHTLRTAAAMAVQERFTFLVLLGRLDVWWGHPRRVLHVRWPLDETLKDIVVRWVMQVILCVESLCRNVVADHCLTALSPRLLLTQQHHKVLLGFVIQGGVARMVCPRQSCRPIDRPCVGVVLLGDHWEGLLMNDLGFG